MTSLLFILMLFGSALLLFSAAVRGYQAWKKNFQTDARVRLDDMFLFVDPSVLVTANVLMLIAVPAVVWLITGLLPLAIFSAIVTALFPRFAWTFMQNRRKQKLVEQMPDALVMMAGSLRAGAGLTAALEMVVNEIGAPISQEFAILLREQRLGIPLEDSLRGMGARLRLEDVDLFVSALSIAKEVGGNLSETLDRLASTLRAKIAMEGKIRALTAQGKLQGIVVGLLPIILGVALYYMEPKAMGMIVHTLWGWLVIGFVAIMLTLGGLMIKKIVTIDV